MDELTRSIVALEGMQDVPLPGMEVLNETPPKISAEVSEVFWFRVVNERGDVYHSRAYGGFYPSQDKAERAIKYIDNWRGHKWTVQATKVVWYDVT